MDLSRTRKGTQRLFELTANLLSGETLPDTLGNAPGLTAFKREEEEKKADRFSEKVSKNERPLVVIIRLKETKTKMSAASKGGHLEHAQRK